jgi:hypothetical protein
MNQKLKQVRFPKYLWHFHTPKKFTYSHLFRPGSGFGAGPRRPDPQHWFIDNRSAVLMRYIYFTSFSRDTVSLGIIATVRVCMTYYRGQSLDFRRLKLEVFSLTLSFLVTSSQ